jgi:CRP/FNR family cyclic AMP-dependent transcriptional regulator
MAIFDREDARAVLAQASWMGADLIEPLIRHGRIIRLAPGQWAQAEGEEETGLLVVIEGVVQMLCKAPGDREVLIGQGGPGYALGQTTRFGGGPRIVTVVSAGRSRVLRITDRALTLIAAEAPQIWQAVAALLYLQMRALAQLVVETVALPPRQRLASRLDLLSRAPLPEAGRQMTLRLPQQALGEMLGLSRKTVNGLLAEFEAAGLIARGYGAITVLDAAGLRRIAER